jgi:hypothetical protein
MNEILSVIISFHIHFLHFLERIFRIYEFFIFLKPSSSSTLQFLVSGAGLPAPGTPAFFKFNCSIPCLRPGPRYTGLLQILFFKFLVTGASSRPPVHQPSSNSILQFLVTGAGSRPPVHWPSSNSFLQIPCHRGRLPALGTPAFFKFIFFTFPFYFILTYICNSGTSSPWKTPFFFFIFFTFIFFSFFFFLNFDK